MPPPIPIPKPDDSNEMDDPEKRLRMPECFVIGPSSIHGWGGFARKDLPPKTRIVEYAGEKIDKLESKRRCLARNEYLFFLDEVHDLDGSVPWNPARFINHSCAPNAHAEWIGGHIWILADRWIRKGEEITMNYGFDLDGYQAHPCRCGAPNCVGFIVAETFFEIVRKRHPKAAAAKPTPGK